MACPLGYAPGPRGRGFSFWDDASGWSLPGRIFRAAMAEKNSGGNMLFRSKAAKPEAAAAIPAVGPPVAVPGNSRAAAARAPEAGPTDAPQMSEEAQRRAAAAIR